LRGKVRVAVRCPCGLPSVIETYPIVDGQPFPTLFWLTCVRASKAVGGLEAAGHLRRLSERLSEDEDFAAAYAEADRDYVGRRDALYRLDDVGGIGGGPADRVKCLHANYAHHLVCGCNPVGAWTAEQIGDVLRPPPCIS
jgi:hypothetical protein